jgi:DnaJ domain
MNVFWNELGEMIGGALGEIVSHLAAHEATRRHWANQPETPEQVDVTHQIQEFLQNHHVEIVFHQGAFYTRLVPNASTAGRTFEQYATNGGRPPGSTPPPPRRPRPQDLAAQHLRELGYKSDQAPPSRDELQMRFRDLARKYHPDVNKRKNAPERMTRINQAYQWLKDNPW